MKSKIVLRKGDITEIEADAIVNAANNDLILGGGVAGAILRKGGQSIQDECDKVGTIPLGEAAVTNAGNLKAKYIIHAASMELGSWTKQENLEKAIKNSLERAEEKQIKTIAFPAIGTGIAGFPLYKCAELTLNIISQHLKQTPTSIEKVFIVLFDERSLKTFQEYYDILPE